MSREVRIAGRLQRRRSWQGWVRLAILTVVLFGLCIPIVIVLPLRWIPPPTTAFMLRHRFVVSGSVDSRSRYRWTDWDQISSHLAVAVIAAEDQKFLDHHGFDVESIQDALADAQRGRRLRGPSTISQQVSKNLLLWPSRSLARKGLEAYVTVFIELLWTKRRILEMYLNVAEFGDGIFGIAAASEYFFDTVPAHIEVDNAALLAAVLPNPAVFRVDEPSAYVRERQSWIRRQMTQVGGVELLEGLEER